jgi:hypothetical protein
LMLIWMENIAGTPEIRAKGEKSGHEYTLFCSFWQTGGVAIRDDPTRNIPTNGWPVSAGGTP